VVLEGPGGSTAAGGGSAFGGRGGDRGDRRGDREARRGGGEGGGFSQADLFSLPTWAERLKKLEEIKGELGPERYERMKRFMTERAQREQNR